MMETTTVVIHDQEPVLNVILPEVEEDHDLNQGGFDYIFDFAMP